MLTVFNCVWLVLLVSMLACCMGDSGGGGGSGGGSGGSASGSSKKRFQKKHQNRPTAPKHECGDLAYFTPTIDRRTYVVKSTDTPSIALLGSSKRDADDDSPPPPPPSPSAPSCSLAASLAESPDATFELEWRYHFFESPRCIRVELDMLNTSRFRSLLNMSYYVFSYREMSRPNVQLKRQPIGDDSDTVNVITIHRVKIKPYVVCVAFYATGGPLSATLFSNDTSADAEQTTASPNGVSLFANLFYIVVV